MIAKSVPEPADGRRAGPEPIVIDGSFGEGGGQIIRTSLSASLMTGTPVELIHIRAKRSRPGLLAQHLTAVRAAAEIGNAGVDGDQLGSDRLTFRPGPVRPGKYRFDVGTAGSASLVLQTVLVPLAEAGGESEVTISGGTHNVGAPPYEFLELAFLPVLRRMGVDVDLQLVRPGFHPAGGGQIRATIREAQWRPLTLTGRGEIRSVQARAIVSRLPVSIAHRELAVLKQRLGWPADALTAQEVDAYGPGNAVVAIVESEHITEVFTGFGRRGLPAEKVAESVADEVDDYLRAGVPVGVHLADQLLLPIVRAPGSRFLTHSPSQHFETNLEVLRSFYATRITVEETDAGILVRS